MFDHYCKPGKFPKRNGRLRGVVSGLSAALLLTLLHTQAEAQEPKADEYRAKAHALANFPSFIEWNAAALPPEKAPFLICVYGDYPFGLSLAEMAQGIKVQERRIEIRTVHQEAELRSCQVLFVGKTALKRYGSVLQAVRDRSVLTVGETPEFLAAGGIVSLSVQAGVIRLEINLEAAKRAHLKINSRLLAMAQRVSNPEVAAKN